MENLNIDYKFSIEYDSDRNDRPVRWMRYGEEWPASTKWEENNAVTAMFYRMLEYRAEITQLRAEIAAERELADRLATQLKSWTGDDPDYPDDTDALATHANRRHHDQHHPIPNQSTAA